MNNESECFTGISKHEKTMVKHERAARVFLSIVFECLDYPGETLARVVYMLDVMILILRVNMLDDKYFFYRSFIIPSSVAFIPSLWRFNMANLQDLRTVKGRFAVFVKSC